MRLIRLFLIGFSICMLMFYCAQPAGASDDWELWVADSVKVKVSDRINLNFLEELYMRQDMGDFYTHVIYVGPSFKINKYIDTAVWYKYVDSKKDGRWSDSHRYDLDLTLSYVLAGFKLSNRSRFENNVTSSSWLYRDRIKAARDIEAFNKKFTPYISNEFFLNMNPTDGYSENRASIGISTDFIFDTTLTLYYMSGAKKADGNWTCANILGVSSGLSF